MKVIHFLWMVVPALLATQVNAARIADIANTKHNLSSTWGGLGSDNRTVKAVSETQICVFCHTPHAAENLTGAPLWNRKVGTSAYQMYNSSSMESEIPTGPSSSSKLCLSCHDGTMAIGAVNVLNGGFTDQDPATEDIQMNGTGFLGRMPDGYGATSGFTRNLGINLTNDHPISFTYDSTLAANDGELRDPAGESHLDLRSSGVRPAIPLVEDSADGNAKVECVSCHDPHIRDDSGEDIKFLRLNRFQKVEPTGGAFDEENDIICLGCHSKEGWEESAHANAQVADEIYTTDAAALRGFPDALPVWRAACLNCHDTHTVQGSRRLLREGTDGTGSPKTGGNAAIEETCYQCHSNDGSTLTLQGDNTEVPDIKGDFQLPRHMPITTAEQPGGLEIHDIGNTGVAGDGKDFIETPETLGKGVGNLINRHVECTDCHNPHRVIKNNLASDNPYYAEAAGTHQHTGTIHNNLISGVLRGSWGVEPVYSSNSFHSSPSGFNVKRGLPTMNVSMAGDPDSYTYVTREYQICMKCHSNYAFDDNNTPILGSFGNGTPFGTNGMIRYTNQAKEFQAPAAHQGMPDGVGADGGACDQTSGMGPSADGTTNNHRSWHPVMEPTGRTAAIRGMNADLFLPPWNAGVGTQTMYCSDCHGSDTAAGTAEPTGGVNGNPWGPHGSNNDFILKGNWTNATGTGEQSTGLCFKCHDYDQYANPNTSWASAKQSGFRCAGYPGCLGRTGVNVNLHLSHAKKIKNGVGGTHIRCNWCHVAVPHGFKNKALLANIITVGEEVGEFGCVRGKFGPPSGWTEYTKEPYYYQARLGFQNFKDSGNWAYGACFGPMLMDPDSGACATIP